MLFSLHSTFTPLCQEWNIVVPQSLGDRKVGGQMSAFVNMLCFIITKNVFLKEQLASRHTCKKLMGCKLVKYSDLGWGVAQW
jgi:hypothetical protein